MGHLFVVVFIKFDKFELFSCSEVDRKELMGADVIFGVILACFRPDLLRLQDVAHTSEACVGHLFVVVFIKFDKFGLFLCSEVDRKELLSADVIFGVISACFRPDLLRLQDVPHTSEARVGHLFVVVFTKFDKFELFSCSEVDRKELLSADVIFGVISACFRPDLLRVQDVPHTSEACVGDLFHSCLSLRFGLRGERREQACFVE